MTEKKLYRMSVIKQDNVYDEARKRIAFLFDEFENVAVSFSGGKDSTVCLNLVLDKEKAEAYRIIDNLTRDATTWDMEKLKEELTDLDVIVPAIKELPTVIQDNIELGIICPKCFNKVEITEDYLKQ